MAREIMQNYNKLVEAVAAMPEVLSIGKSGGEALPVAGESDIDLFVFCDAIPDIEKRRVVAERLGACVTDLRVSDSSGKYWGMCDFVCLGQTEVCLMYYTVAWMNAEIESVLSGARPDKEDSYFYPTGRCATLLTMHILCDKQGAIAAMRQRLHPYPKSLATRLIHYHLGRLSDVEDLERAVSRKDALFYHFALDLSLDHFLQALFACNRCYFPSRKRTLSFIETFAQKPVRCAERLLGVVSQGANGETVSRSYEEFASLCRELNAICETNRKEPWRRDGSSGEINLSDEMGDDRQRLDDSRGNGE